MLKYSQLWYVNLIIQLALAVKLDLSIDQLDENWLKGWAGNNQDMIFAYSVKNWCKILQCVSNTCLRFLNVSNDQKEKLKHL